jgi:hypothetical protein
VVSHLLLVAITSNLRYVGTITILKAVRREDAVAFLRRELHTGHFADQRWISVEQTQKGKPAEKRVKILRAFRGLTANVGVPLLLVHVGDPPASDRRPTGKRLHGFSKRIRLAQLMFIVSLIVGEAAS